MNHLGDIAQLMTAGGLLLNGLMTVLTYLKSHRIEANVQIIEKATNSMKDALVQATAKASLLEGTAAGLEQGRKEVR